MKPLGKSGRILADISIVSGLAAFWFWVKLEYLAQAMAALGIITGVTALNVKSKSKLGWVGLGLTGVFILLYVGMKLAVYYAFKNYQF